VLFIVLLILLLFVVLFVVLLILLFIRFLFIFCNVLGCILLFFNKNSFNSFNEFSNSIFFFSNISILFLFSLLNSEIKFLVFFLLHIF
jgi:hypothetical protein